MSRYGFEELNLNRIWLRVYDTNPRARKAYEKAGFVYEGTLRQAEYKHGRYIRCARDEHFKIGLVKN